MLPTDLPIDATIPADHFISMTLTHGQFTTIVFCAFIAIVLSILIFFCDKDGNLHSKD